MVLRHLIPLVFLSSLMETERLLLLMVVEIIVEKSALVSLLSVVILSSLMLVKVEKSWLMPTVVMLSQSLTMVG